MITCVFYDPRVDWVAGAPNGCTITPAGSYVRTITPDAYGQRISAFGGYDTAQMQMNTQTDWLEDWAYRGLGRHVEVYQDVTRCWEGFVNQITIVMGAVTVVIGPFLEICNSADGEYKRVYTGTNPPATGASRFAGIVEDDASQRRYGIRRHMLSLGAVQDTEAVQAVERWVANRAWPSSQKTLSTTAARASVLQLDLLGYVHRMDYPYYAESDTTVSLSSKIETVLDACPDGLFSSANADIATNALAVAENDDQYRSGLVILRELVQLGDAAGNRYVFSVGNDRKIVYRPVSDMVRYTTSLMDGNGTIREIMGQTVAPALVRAGEWLAITDLFFPPSTIFGNRDAMRDMFIEQVDYQLPADLSLNGAKTVSVYNKLAKLGLRGESA